MASGSRESGGSVRGCNPPAVTLRILSGVHGGADIPSLALPLKLGSDIDSDVVLADPDVMPDHLRLIDIDGTLAIAAVDGAVDIDGFGRLKALQGFRVNLPVQLCVGSTTLRIDRAGTTVDDAAVSPPGRSPWWHRSLVATLGLGLVGVAVIPSGLSAFSRVTSVQSEQSPASASAARAPDAIDPVTFLQGELNVRGLSHLDLKRTGSSLAVAGMLTETEYQAWLQLRRLADEKSGSPLVIESRIIRRELPLPSLDISAVKLGGQPYVIATSGERLRPGDVVSPGWVLARLENHAVVLAHGSREYDIAY
jgi:hypothetical protein